MHYAANGDRNALDGFRISVEGCDGQSLSEVFRGIPNLTSPKRLDSRRILFQSLRFTRDLSFKSNSLRVALNSGSPSPNKRCFEVQIEFDGWLPEDKEMFTWFREAHRRFRSKYRNKNSVDARLYFIGEQDERDLMTFIVRDARKIALVYPAVESLQDTEVEDGLIRRRSASPEVSIDEIRNVSGAKEQPASRTYTHPKTGPKVISSQKKSVQVVSTQPQEANRDVKQQPSLHISPSTLVEQTVQPPDPKPSRRSNWKTIWHWLARLFNLNSP